MMMAKILIVDNQPMNLQLLGELLRDRYEVFVATSGQKALQLAGEKSPDLILMDVVMPEMDGFTACRILKSQDSTAKIPVIFITASIASADIVKGFQAGGQDYIAKPFNPLELYARVNSHIELKKSREAVEEYASQLEKKNEELKTLLDKLEIMATSDPLTGLANRRSAIARMNDEISRFTRNHQIFSLLMADIDNFKTINDSYGHETGDKVLKHVAEVMKQSLRQHDTVSRWGGEEFLIILPETDAPSAETIAEKIRSRIEASPVIGDNATIPITLTIGCAQVDPGLDIDENISRADQAMYEGKHSSKNCVRMAE